MSRTKFIQSIIGKMDPKSPKSGGFYMDRFAAAHGITVSQLKGVRGSRELSELRQWAYAYVWERTGLSFVKLGELFGGRHHTTIMHGIDAYEARAAS